MVRRFSSTDTTLLDEGSFRIEQMRPHHLPYVVAIERKSFPQPWSYSLYFTELKNRVAHYFVGLRNNQVIGYVGMWILWEVAHITTLAVHPSFRAKGFGRRILLYSLDYARVRGCEEVLLEVRISNTVAQELYREFGFQFERVRTRYYSDGEDALVMRKILLLCKENR